MRRVILKICRRYECMHKCWTWRICQIRKSLRRINSTERENLKSKILQDEVNRLILALDEKDNSRCEQITAEILRVSAVH